ncbi:ATP-binding protein [Rhodopila sp.]|uniref:ATP-binding protein n=1 Tax=Rhodopila sp. TaxID=2480087 RepID=UPI003D107C4F
MSATNHLTGKPPTPPGNDTAHHTAPGCESLFTTAGGQMAALIEATDWTNTGVGPRHTWPHSLTTVLRMMLASRYQMWMAWGRDLTFFCNDAYTPTLGDKHPWALGQPTRLVWSEIWPDVGPRIASVIRTGQATWDEALMLFLQRRGYAEETYHTFSYSPLPDDDGGIGGMLCVVMEETQRVVGERRLATLRDLAGGLAGVRSEADVLAAVATALARNTRDLPCSLIYLPDGDSPALRRHPGTPSPPAPSPPAPSMPAPSMPAPSLDPNVPTASMAAPNAPAPSLAAPDLIDGPADLPWPAAERPIEPPADHPGDRPARDLRNLDAVAGVPTGAWDKPPRRLLITQIPAQGQQPGSGGLFIAGLNPHRPFDEAYADFIDLVAAQIAAGLAAARIYQAERRRAEELAEIDRAKTAFFSNVSHEFRTPLTLMLGPLEEAITALAKPHPQATHRLSMVHRNGLRLLRLVNTLLEFSRIEAGRVRARFQPIELGAYTEELASNFRSACDRAGLRLATNCPRLDRPLYVDPEMWERIVLNLVSNAFKYTLSGGITVSLDIAPDDDRCAILSVTDTGIGIPAAELPHIFDRFHRIEGQRGRTMEGTGIGLALVNELVRLHGGTIGVQSRIDTGTTVWARLPFGRDHLPPDRVSETARLTPEGIAAASFVEEALRWLPEADPPDADAPNAETPTADAPDADTARADAIRADTAENMESFSMPSDLGGEPEHRDQPRRHILLADDNADMRDYVVRLLRPRYDVEAVRDGQLALAAAQARRPDLILSDVMMPRMDGFGLLAGIRADPALADLPVILLSARAGEEARVEGLDAGADDYLVKPFTARELTARVRSNLELARLRQQARDTLLEANEMLESRVASEIGRRAKVEEALRQSQKMEAIGHLTGGVAHDFNNLLTVIGGGVETLARMLTKLPLGDDEARIRRALDMIAQGSQRAATLTHRLLAFARRQTLDPKPLDANKLVAGMSELLRRTLGEAVAMETVLAGGLWRTAADANQLENALLNLAVNARDAMSQGGKLTIETANTHLDDAYTAAHDDVSPGQYVMIAVSDTGGGMDADTLDRVFEPFFTTKDVGHGTGLGLSQVWGFIKQSSGHVKLYSEPGQGTAVKLYLPRLLADTPEAESRPEPDKPPPGRGETILVVEDEPSVREHSAASLRELGYHVLVVGDAHQALRVLTQDPAIAVLFTDIGLPGGITGRQLADTARQRRPGLKVVYTTGYARNAIVHGEVLEPATELLPKPFSYAALASKIRAVLDR